jgi:hypothetical protein
MGAKQNDMLMQIILISAAVSLFSIDKAGFLGVYVIFLAFIMLFYLNMNISDPNTTWMTIFNKTSQILVTIILLFVYIFFCIIRYKDYIIENKMPSSWYVFSYVILLILMFHGYVIRQSLEGKQSYWCGIAMILNVMLFVCVFLEYTSATYFRTDGFRV